MTLMHISSRAPELSAACKRVLSWIMILPSRRSFRGRAFDDAHQAPGLVPRQRPALRDRDRVALAALVLLVVREQFGLLPHVLPVGRVLQQPIDPDADRLVHLAADHGAGQGPRVVFSLNNSHHDLLPAACARLISLSTVLSRAI